MLLSDSRWKCLIGALAVTLGGPAAERLRDMGARCAIVTGGHGTGRDSVDVVFDGRTFTELRTARVGLPAVARVMKLTHHATSSDDLCRAVDPAGTRS